MHSLLTNALTSLAILFLLGLTSPVQASFIESTIGTAVVNDATASYHNPAALTLVEKTQMVGLVSLAKFNTDFTGQAKQAMSSITQYGRSQNQTNYYLPSLYLSRPADKISLGFAVIANSFNKELEGNSILRYAQSDNHTDNVDLVPALGFKVNDYFSIGAGLSFSKARFILEPRSGIASLNMPDSQSHNESHGNSWGGDLGFILKPTKTTLVGFNYRSVNVYRQRGTSVLNGPLPIISNNYNFKLWTPARSVLSINQFLTTKLGIIGTVQYFQWSVFKTVTIHSLATQLGFTPTIVDEASVPYYFHNAWLLTLGSHYRIQPNCILRIASTYVQSPGNSNYQIKNGDSFVLGASLGYELSKTITIDASFAHGFFRAADIHINSGRNRIEGINDSSRNALSLKLTISV